MTETFDYLIIGGGPAGYEAAALAARRGLSTALVERDLVGGTCLNRGCIPTKCFCSSADTAGAINSAAAMGIELPEGFAAIPSMHAIVERKNRIVDQLRQGVEAILADVEVIRGEARFTGPKEVEVGDRRISAERIIIATGSEPAILPVEGAVLALTSNDILDLNTLPASLAIIGGGVIGMEFASIFSRLGVKVCVVEYCREILPNFDRDIAKRLRTSLKQSGIEIYTQAEVTRIEAGPGEMRRVEFTAKGKPSAVEAEMVLMATGRKAVIPEGAAEVGFAIGRRGFEVDGNMLTNIPEVWAIGDCNGICQLAHAATAQARMVMGENVDLSVIPSAVFTHPECAMAGLTSEQCDELRRRAEESGTSVPAYIEKKAFFRANGKACAMGETEGMVKLIVNADTDLIAGCHICGPHASDLIAEAALAMSARLTLDELHSTVHAHPSLAEILGNI